MLIKRGLLPESIKITTITSIPERENTKKEINPKYNFLKHIRNSPKKVEIRDMETGEIIVYSSMNKSANAFNQQSRLISAYDGKVWMHRYAIKILTKSNQNLKSVHIRIRIKISNTSQTFCYHQTGLTTSCLK